MMIGVSGVNKHDCPLLVRFSKHLQRILVVSLIEIVHSWIIKTSPQKVKILGHCMSLGYNYNHHNHE